MYVDIGSFRAEGTDRFVQESVWGMSFSPNESGSTPRSLHRSFSLERSGAILRSIKEKLGQGHSVTHLGHAAMVLALFKSKPIAERPTESTSLVNLVCINGRRYLRTTYAKSKAYVPMCRAFAAIEFRDVDRYVLSGGVGERELQPKLKIACEEARESYQAIRERESLLTEAFDVTEHIWLAQYVERLGRRSEDVRMG